MNNEHKCEEVQKFKDVEIIWDEFWILGVGDEYDYASIEIHYCPFCGEQLEEDVDD